MRIPKEVWEVAPRKRQKCKSYASFLSADNALCEDVGCGEWKAPMVPNPEYKGKWKAPYIDNPNYQGEWKPRVIPNPDFFEDLEPFKMSPIVSSFQWLLILLIFQSTGMVYELKILESDSLFLQM